MGKLVINGCTSIGLVQPNTGRFFQLFLPRVKTELISQARAGFAKWADPRGQKSMVLLVDNASWHRAKKLLISPNGLSHRLPPCTPELQPIEPRWPSIRETAANRGFRSIGYLRRAVPRRCQWLADHPDTVRRRVGFRWAMNR